MKSQCKFCGFADSARIGIAREDYDESIPRHDLGRMDVLCTHCDALHWIDERLARSSQSNPSFSTCCNQGKVCIPRLLDPPQALWNLFTSNDAQCKEFREHIRQYNMALAFTSLGVKEDAGVNARGGWVFRILGQLCHLSGALTPGEGSSPQYAQLYIYDPQQALQQRMHRNSNLREDTMYLLQTLLSRHHRYAPIYKHAYEVLCEHENTTDITVRLRMMPGQDRRRYNLPVANEVAVILPGDGSSPDRRDIVLHCRNEASLLRVNEGHAAYCTLHYVLFFPHGEHEWHDELRQNVEEDGTVKRTRITQTRFAAYRLQTRQNEKSLILRGGKLLQQYMVDMWAVADQARLSYLRFHQSDLRAALYSGLEDSLSGRDEPVDLHNLGQRTVLPSSYIGGPRHMQQRFQDAMAIARFFRKVDLFITMTANPQWEEILRELLPGQTPYDRPDLVTRVFKLKLDALIHDITKKGVLGATNAYVYVIEFQKRGLPHCHILIIFRDDYRLRTPADIDSLISAEWPDPATQPRLFEIVKKCMVHGPCGAANPHAPCMENGCCTKFFPKPFQDQTSMDVDGYPLYQRRDDGRAYDVRGQMVDNSMIVPYVPYLSAKYDCHINAECVATLKSIKYPFKYIHKGGDRACLEYNVDEITNYIDGRYIGASEAAWRIYHHSVHEQVRTILNLGKIALTNLT